MANRNGRRLSHNERASMSTNTITMDVEIPNVSALVDDEITDPVVVQSIPVLHEGLQWTAEVQIRRPGPDDNARRNLNDKHIFAYLCCTNPATENQNWRSTAFCKAKLVKLNEEDPYRHHYYNGTDGSLDFDFANQGRGGGGWNLQLTVDELLGHRVYVKDDKALVRMTVKVASSSGLHFAQKRKISETVANMNTERTLALLRSGTGMNVTLVTKDGKKIGAHRDVLMRSVPAFVAMLESSGMKEGAEVNVQDMTEPCLQIILEVIYGAPLSSLDNTPLTLIKELLVAAGKYEFEALKDYCATLLLERVNPGNMIQTHRMAKKLKLDETAMKEVEDFIKEHVGELLEQIESGTLEDDEEEAGSGDE